MESPAPQRRFLGQIQPGVEVYDVAGDKIGSVARVHRVDETPEHLGAATFDEVLEVKTGFLGFGKRLYVPVGEVQETLRDSLFLAHSKDGLASLGYDSKPARLS
jgi:hypothetical protein